MRILCAREFQRSIAQSVHLMHRDAVDGALGSGVLDGVDYHHTGEVRRIDRKGINRQLDERSIVLLSPLGYSPTGEVFNLTLEEVATATAAGIRKPPAAW